jgi:hypothetical protein
MSNATLEHEHEHELVLVLELELELEWVINTYVGEDMLD